MKLLKILFYILLGLAALVVLLGLFARHNYHIERSIEIAAPRQVVLDEVRFFKNFSKWSPWAALDPSMKVRIEGTDGEVGALYKWEGNDDVGAGQQVIKAIRPDGLDIEVTFTKPWKSTSPTFWKLEGDTVKTKATWGFDMYIGFPWNAMAMLTDINAGVGKDYERGLGNLKKVCESLMHKKYRGYDIEETTEAESVYAGVRQNLTFEELKPFLLANYPKILEGLKKSSMDPADKTTATLTWVWDETTKKTDIAAAIPVKPSKKQPEPGLELFNIKGGKALLIDYYGIYDSIGTAHMAMADYMLEKKLRNIPPVIEHYITDPKTEPDTAKWLTKLIYFVEPIPADSLKTNK